MPHIFTVEEAASRLADLISILGPGDEITLTSHNRAVAKIIPQTGPRRQAGACKGMIIENPEVPDNSYLEDFKDHM